MRQSGLKVNLETRSNGDARFALRSKPEQFDFSHGWLEHILSRHNFEFDRQGRVRILANCDCSRLAVASEQDSQLYVAF